MTMQKVNSVDAQNEFHFVMEQVCSGLGPVLISGTRGSAVLVSEADWSAMQENLQRLALREARDTISDRLTGAGDSAGEETRL
jgi:PHD/YefM family antitoxin component YafN of YafNO toxin-antitoxin module